MNIAIVAGTDVRAFGSGGTVTLERRAQEVRLEQVPVWGAFEWKRFNFLVSTFDD